MFDSNKLKFFFLHNSFLCLCSNIHMFYEDKSSYCLCRTTRKQGAQLASQVSEYQAQLASQVEETQKTKK